MSVNKEIILPNDLQRGMVWNKPKTPLMLQFEEETKHNTIRNNKITGKFIYWLFKNNLKTSNFADKSQYREQKEIQSTQILEKINQKIKLTGQDIMSDQMLEFFLNSLQEHYYFSKKLLVETYAIKMNFYYNNSVYNRGFIILIKRFTHLGIIERYSHTNFKVNKDKLREFIKCQK